MPAHTTWNAANETLEQVEARIHDGASGTDLIPRGKRYVDWLFELFPWFKAPTDKPVVEVGPGVGYIMQAFAERNGLDRIFGLDVAEGMIRHANQRIRRDGLSPLKFNFTHYDGRRFPWGDQEIGAFYSVAAIQHVPKIYAYNILLEMNRCLAEGGNAAVHLLAWAHLPNSIVSFEQEIANQLDDVPGHWHHYWDRIELHAIMAHGLKSSYFEIKESGDQIWIAWRK